MDFGAKFAEEAAPIENRDDDGSTSLDISAASTFDEIQMVYIRHGESMGNAKRFWQAADSILTSKGRDQARVGITSGSQRKRIIVCSDPAHTIYAVSPLRRAMGTLIISYVRACTKANKTITFPNIENFQIWPSLREKRKTLSEDVNSGMTSSKFYIMHQAIQECQLLINEKKLLATELPKCEAFGTVMALKWEQSLQADPDALGWSQLKSNRGKFLKQMVTLSTKTFSSVRNHNLEIKYLVAVAHSGTGRIRYGCAMAAGSDHTRTFNATQQQANLLYGSVQGMETLGNAGSMILKLNVAGNAAWVADSGTFYAMVQDDKPMPFAASLTQTDGNDIFTKECRHFNVIPPNSKFTKAEGFYYTGPNHFDWHSVFYVTQQPASQATFSHIPGNPSSLSFSHDFGGKLYSAIDRKLNLCTATIYQIVKILIVCGDARVSDQYYYREYPKFSKNGVKVKFHSPAQAKHFHDIFQTYKAFV